MKNMTLAQAQSLWQQQAGNLCAQYKLSEQNPQLLKSAIEKHIESLRDAEPTENTLTALITAGKQWRMCVLLLKAREKKIREIKDQMTNWFSEYDALQKD